jgi:hypothetical protein
MGTIWQDLRYGARLLLKKKRANDPFSVLVAAAEIACYVPARSATRVEPMAVLRYE